MIPYKATWKVLALVMAGMVLVAGPAAAIEYHLRAEEAVVHMPDGRDVPVWGFALNGGDVTVPGPMLTVPVGDPTLTIYLTNNLPVPVSIVIPGQTAAMTPVRHVGGPYDGRVRSFTHETEPANTTEVAYTWSSLRPGTFIYHSGTHAAIQVQMGLYGCVKKNTAAKTAYPGVVYDNEVVVFFSELDPDLHDVVAAGDYGPAGDVTSPIDYDPQYFLVNGQPYSAGATPIPAGWATGRTLVRLLNAGLKSHAPAIYGHYVSVRAEDGYPREHPAERFSLTLPAMKTTDVLMKPEEEGTFAVYDRTLHLTNGAVGPGGMLAHIEITKKPKPTIQGLGDFNANGFSDLLMREASQELWVRLMVGDATDQAATPATPDAGWVVQGVDDFSNDGKSDILWRNTDTDEIAVWLMNGTSISSAGIVRVVSSAWSVQGVGDFNGGGRADILWRNTATNQVAIWLMNGVGVARTQVLMSVDPKWQIRGVGDFNGNGKADILWEDTLTGDIAIWLMNGVSISSIGVIGNVSPASGWTIAGLGDLDGDGKCDIAWYQGGTRQLGGWLMNGLVRKNAGAITDNGTGLPVTVPVDWAVGGIGDFNNNNRDDFLLGNSTTGELVIWYMDKLKRVGTGTPDSL
ncbi:MAG: VCBS repeat-containing protein [Verrucomicrobia bacterium]|nr:VCBS repeat-containing protein [Verrucomicrobiota bacterium]